MHRAHHRVQHPQGSRGLCQGGPCAAPAPNNPVPGGRWAQPHQREPWPCLGGCSPSQPWGQAGAQLDPSSSWRGWAGASLKPQELHPAPVSPHDLGQAFPFWAHHPGARRCPGEMLQLKFHPFLPGEMPSAGQSSHRRQEQQHQICSQLEMLSERGGNLIRAEPEPRLRRCGCCACQMNFMRISICQAQIQPAGNERTRQKAQKKHQKKATHMAQSEN